MCLKVFQNLQLSDQDYSLNDLVCQFPTVDSLGHKQICNQSKFVFEPSKYQAYSQTLIPKSFKKNINRQKENQFKLSPVGKINKTTGHLIDEYYYQFYDCTLEIWKAGEQDLQSYKSIDEKIAYTQNQVIFRDQNQIQCILFVEDHQREFKPAILIATDFEIKLLDFGKNKESFARNQEEVLPRHQYDFTSVQESHYESLGLAEGEEISCLIQCKKTGRIYYASHQNSYQNTHVRELKLQQNPNLFPDFLGRTGRSLERSYPIQKFKYLKETFIGHKKRLQSRDADERNYLPNFIEKVLPISLNIFSEIKYVEQIVIDSQRNIIYVLFRLLQPFQINLNSNDHGNQIQYNLKEAIIEVYDLGTLGSKCEKECRINQQNLFQKMQEFVGNQMIKNQEIFLEEVQKLQIIRIQNIQQNESSISQLMVLLQNCQRVYLKFQIKDVHQKESQKDVEDEKLQFDTLREYSLTNKWMVYAIQSFPDWEQGLQDYQNQCNPFQDIVILKKKQDELFNNAFSYCNNTSTLIYSNYSNYQQGQEENFFQICMVGKNESEFCQQKDQNILQNLDNNVLQTKGYESFSVQIFEKQDKNEDEYIIEIKSASQLGFINGECPLKIDRLLGGNQSLKIINSFGVSNKQWYLPYSQNQRSVYHEIIGENKIKILTNFREICLVEISPINQLFHILQQITTQPIRKLQLQLFEEFILKFGIDEVCFMLLNICISSESMKQIESSKIKQALNKWTNQSKNKQSDLKQYSKNQVFVNSIPRSNSQSKIYTASLNKSSIFQTTSFQPVMHGRPYQSTRRGGTNLLSAQNSQINQTSFLNQRQFHNIQQNQFSDSLPFLYKNEETFDNSNLTSQKQDEISKNCVLVKLEKEQQIIKLANQLFQFYGDSIKQKNQNQFYNFFSQQDQNLQTDLEIVFSCKFKAIYIYLQRLIRPIWNTNLTRMKDHNDFDKQISNFQCVEGALEKLIHLQIYLQKNKNLLVKNQSLEDLNLIFQSNDMAYSRFQNTLLQDHLILILDTNQSARKYLEKYQEDNLKIISSFIQRCIDTIQFFKLFSFVFEISDSFQQKENQIFQILQIKLQKESNGKKYLKQLGKTKLGDFILVENLFDLSIVEEQIFEKKSQLFQKINENNFIDPGQNEGSNVKLLVKKLLDLVVYFKVRQLCQHQQISPKTSEDPKKYFQLLSNLEVEPDQIKKIVEMIQKLCPSFFQNDESYNFKAEAMLHQALEINQIEKKQVLVGQALSYFKEKPQSILLFKTVETFCKLNCFFEIIELVAIKMNAILDQIDKQKVLVTGQNQNNNIQSFISSRIINQNISMESLQNEIAYFEDELNECQSFLIYYFILTDKIISEVYHPSLYSPSKDFFQQIELIQETTLNDFQFQNLSLHDSQTKQNSNFQIFYLLEKYLTKNFVSRNNLIQFFENLRNNIVQQINILDDQKLIKRLFICYLRQNRQFYEYENLPKIDLHNFTEVVSKLFNEKNTKQRISFIFLLLCLDDVPFIKENNNIIQLPLKQLLVVVTKQICQDQEILQSFKDPSDSMISLQEKIQFLNKCIHAVHQIQNFDQINELNKLKDTLNLQDQIIGSLKDKMKYYEQNKAKIIDFQNQIEELNLQTFNWIQLSEIIRKYSLIDLQYQLLDDKQGEFDEYLDVFQQAITEVNEVYDLTKSKKCLDQEYMKQTLKLVESNQSKDLLIKAISILFQNSLQNYISLVNLSNQDYRIALSYSINEIFSDQIIEDIQMFSFLGVLFKELGKNETLQKLILGSDILEILIQIERSGEFNEEKYFNLCQLVVAWYLYRNKHFQELIVDMEYKEKVWKDQIEVVDQMKISQIYQKFVQEQQLYIDEELERGLSKLVQTVINQ